jgi:DNA-binding response OmpR family regulator
MLHARVRLAKLCNAAALAPYGDTLEMLGYRVLSAVSGPAALDVLDRGRPDLVLMDFATRDERRRGGRAGPSALVGMPSSSPATMPTPRRWRNALAGQAVILRKPFDMDELATTVAAAVRPEAAGANSPVSR